MIDVEKIFRQASNAALLGDKNLEGVSAVRIGLQAVARAAAEAMRERCAKVCAIEAEKFNQHSPLNGDKQYAAQVCEQKIRALPLEEK
jgi:methylglyoxal synthase